MDEMKKKEEKEEKKKKEKKEKNYVASKRFIETYKERKGYVVKIKKDSDDDINFIHTIADQIGNVIQVHIQNDLIYEGVFIKFSSESNIILELAHTINDCTEEIIPKDIMERTIIKPQNVAALIYKIKE